MLKKVSLGWKVVEFWIFNKRDPFDIKISESYNERDSLESG